MAITGGIEVSSFFNMRSALPVDGRSVVADLTARDDIESGTRYEGLAVYVVSESKTYQLQGGITDSDWVEVGSGGILTVQDETERDAIDVGVRYEGMIVYVIDDEKTYQLVGGITNDDWKVLGSGSGQGFGGKNYFADPTFQDNVDNALTYKEISATGVAFFDGGGSGTIIASGIDFTTLGYADGTPVRLFSTVGYPSLLDSTKLYYLKIVASTFYAFSETPGGVAVSGLDSNATGTYTIRIYAPNHFTPSINTTTPLIEGGSLQIAYTDDGGSGADEGVEFVTKVIDKEDLGKTQFLKITFDPSDANYPSEDMKIKIIDASTGKEASYFASDRIKKIDGALFIPVYVSSTTTRLIVSVHCRTDTAGVNWGLVFGTFELVVDTPVPGAIITPWTAYTPIFGGMGTITANTLEWRQIGDHIELRGGWTTGTVSAATASITLPNSYASKTLSTNASAGTIKVGTSSNPAAKTLNAVVLSASTTLNFQLERADVGTSPLTGGALGNVVLISSTRYEIAGVLSVPASGLSASAMLSTTETLLKGARFRASRNGTNQTGVNPNNSSVKISINSVSAATDFQKGLVYNTANSRFDVVQAGEYDVAAKVVVNSTNVAAGFYRADLYLNGSVISGGYPERPGAATGLVLYVPTTTLKLKAGDYLEVYLFATNNHSSNTLTIDGGATNTWFTGALKFDPTVFTSYGTRKTFKANSGGLVSYAITAGNTGDLASVTLEPGEYDFWAQADWVSNGATTTTLVGLGVSTTSGNSSTGLVDGHTWMRANKQTTSGTHDRTSLNVDEIVVTAPTTYYIKAAAITSITNLQIAWSYSFRKVK